MNHWMRFTKTEQRGLIAWSIFLFVLTMGHTLLVNYLEREETKKALELLDQWTKESQVSPENTYTSKVYSNWNDFSKDSSTNSIQHQPHQEKGIPSTQKIEYASDPGSDSKIKIADSIPTRRASDPSPERKAAPLNINTASQKDFEALGFPEYIAQRVCAFREKVRMFESINDLKEIYGIDTFMVRALADQLFVNLNDLPKLEMNSADASEWMSLKGIGKTYAKRIIEYRNRLGGFSSAHQLLEVYGIDSLLYQSISFRLKVNPQLIKTININTASLQELASHPYISWREADLIEKFRKEHGPIIQLSDCKGLSETWSLKVAPYITY